MATKLQEILLKGNTTNASAVPSSLKVREIAINALDRSLFTNDGNSIVKLYTGTTKWFDVNGNANNALKLGGVLASEYINKEAFNSHINNSTIHITADERTAWNNKWDYNEEIIKGVKVNAAVLSDKATKLATARKIWGKYFDGLADVSGDLTEVGNISASGKATIQGDIISGGEVAAIVGEGTPAGVTDYSALTGKPAINGVTLVSGNNTLATLGIQAAGNYITESLVDTKLDNYTTKTFVANNYAGKAAFNNHTADSVIHITSSERTAWNAKWDYNEATIKAVKVTSASSADSVAWSGISGKPTSFTAASHTHTASDITGLPTSLKNPYKLTFGSKTYDGSAAATITASDLGALTSITKSMVEGVLTGDITSHTHTFASLTSKPTTIAGYGITDAYTSSTIDSKLSGYLPLSGGTLFNKASSTVLNIKAPSSTTDSVLRFSDNSTSEIYEILLRRPTTSFGLQCNINGNYYNLLHAGNFNSYAPTLTGTGASGTWGISISGNAATATNADKLDGFHASDFSRHIEGYAGTFGTKYFKLGNLPESGNSTYDAFLIQGEIGGWSSNEKIVLNVCVSRRGSVTFCGYTQGLWNSNPGIDIGVNYAGEIVLIATRDYCAWTLDLHTIQGTISYTGTTFTPTDTNFVLLSDSNNISKSLADGTVEKATKLQTPRTIWGQRFDGSADVNGIATFIFNDEQKILIEKKAGGSNYCGISFFNDGFKVGTIAASTLLLNPVNGGNVLIGTTTNNGYKLDVNGKTHITGDLIVDGEVSALVA